MLKKLISTRPPPFIKEKRIVFTPKNISQKIMYTPEEAIHLAKVYSIAPFVESIDIAFRLHVDPKRGDQIVRGTCYMPAGLGIKSVLAVFTSETYKEEAYAAGADIAGEEAMQLVINKDLQFDKVLATSEMVDLLKQHGRFLGSKGLMPNPKLGTVVDHDSLTQSIKNAKLGSVTFRIEHNGAMIHSPIGRSDFTAEMLYENLQAFTRKLLELKPPAVKGKYIRSAFITSTHGPSWKMDPESLYALD